MSEPRHESLVAAAMLGIVKAHGWMEMPVALDVNRAVESVGPVRMTREHAVNFARELIDEVCKANQWDLPDYGAEEALVRVALGRAYDELVASQAVVL